MAHWGLLPRSGDADDAAAERPTRLVLTRTRPSAGASTTSTRNSRSPCRGIGSGTTSPELLDLYRTRYRDQRLPFLLVEVRFTPGRHETPSSGPGAGRDTAWLCLCCNQSGAVGDYFADVEEWVRRSDARVHLGKWCEDLDAADIARMHGDGSTVPAGSQPARPDGRFANPFTDRVLGPAGRSAGGTAETGMTDSRRYEESASRRRTTRSNVTRSRSPSSSPGAGGLPIRPAVEGSNSTSASHRTSRCGRCTTTSTRVGPTGQFRRVPPSPASLVVDASASRRDHGDARPQGSSARPSSVPPIPRHSSSTNAWVATGCSRQRN